MTSPSDLDRRVLLLPPTRRDAEATQAIFSEAGIQSEICRDLDHLCEEATKGAGVLLVTEEAIHSSRNNCLPEFLKSQPAWSDVPLIVMTPPITRQPPVELSELGGMQLLQRPLQVRTLISTVQAALRDRARQYKVRESLESQERYSAALAESDRRKSEFLAVLAHELRNPLAPLRTGIDLLLLDEKQAANGIAPMMSRQVSHMARLIDDLMDLSRVSQGKVVLQRKLINLADVIASAVEATRPQIDAAGHELHLAISSRLPVNGDAVRLTQVFANLLTNAAKYTNPGGHIRLTAARSGSSISVSVADDGRGIPERMLGRVFEMFAQVDDSLDRSEGGLGIGLTLVKQLVEMHGGTIAAVSEGVGQGSCFTVTLPLSEESPKPPAPSGPAGYSGPPLQVLIADDNQDAAKMLSLMFRRLGHQVHAVHDGHRAVQAMMENPPDLAILDIGMPVMNGYEAAQAVRKNLNRDRSVYLVALTGWGQDDDRRRALEAGFDTHLVKPVETETLVSLLEMASRRAGSS
ncbi:MAG TPA: ATP-binding protein [Caulifigura sp.]|jgi:signal transduction histidine kinase/ActR/RegA family two-component response regulator|nr:ATP-binding protein [Caulifigura sp.]